MENDVTSNIDFIYFIDEKIKIKVPKMGQKTERQWL